MPVSDYRHISDVLDVIRQVNPQTILDVGVGFGKWGVLCREVLEVYNQRLQPETWTVQIDGIEIHEPYRNPLWEIAYNRLHIGNAFDIVESLGQYDLILGCDVIEHFDKEIGSILLRKLYHRANIVIVTSPRGFMPQGAVHDNEYECHRSCWDESDFRDIPHLYREVGATFIAVLSLEPARLDGIEVGSPLRRLGAKRALAETLRLILDRTRCRVNGIIRRYRNANVG